MTSVIAVDNHKCIEASLFLLLAVVFLAVLLAVLIAVLLSSIPVPSSFLLLHDPTSPLPLCADLPSTAICVLGRAHPRCPRGLRPAEGELVFDSPVVQGEGDILNRGVLGSVRGTDEVEQPRH